MTHPEDFTFMKRAVEIALEAETLGNPPIGSIITLEGEVVSEGGCSLLRPEFQPGRHAETEALKSVPAGLWPRAREMTCYSTLEPCPMCFGALLLHDVGRIVFGALDPLGGSGGLLPHLPPYFNRPRGKPEWIGPIMPEVCDPLFERAIDVLKLRALRDQL
jgi:tRNA(adenine34) deaminase